MRGIDLVFKGNEVKGNVMEGNIKEVNASWSEDNEANQSATITEIDTIDGSGGPGGVETVTTTAKKGITTSGTITPRTTAATTTERPGFFGRMLRFFGLK